MLGGAVVVVIARLTEEAAAALAAETGNTLATVRRWGRGLPMNMAEEQRLARVAARLGIAVLSTRERVYAAIAKHPMIGATDIARLTRLKSSTVRCFVVKEVRAGRLVREGAPLVGDRLTTTGYGYALPDWANRCHMHTDCIDNHELGQACLASRTHP